jgi:hypothetical protein
MLSLALANKNVLSSQKMMLQNGWDVFENKTWWWIHHGHDGSTSEKMYLCQVPNYGFEMIKLRLGGWLAREESLGVVSPSESIKDRANIGLLTEDPLIGHMPRHG